MRSKQITCFKSGTLSLFWLPDKDEDEGVGAAAFATEDLSWSKRL